MLNPAAEGGKKTAGMHDFIIFHIFHVNHIVMYNIRVLASNSVVVIEGANQNTLFFCLLGILRLKASQTRMYLFSNMTML